MKVVARPRRCATLATLALTAAVLAGCNGEYQSNLDPSASAGFAGSAAAPSAGVDAAGKPSAAALISTAAMSGDAPLPAPRPDFGDRKEIAVAPQAAPGPQATNAKTAAELEQKTTVAAAAPKSEDDPEPPLTPGAEGSAKRSFNAYEDGIAAAAAGETPASNTAIRTGTTTTARGAIVSTTAYAAPVAEVNGAASAVRTTAARAYAPNPAIRASLRPSAAAPVLARGAGWISANGDVVTHCFDANLRSALETIARHFNTQVEVTSGYRTNGRRRSMHRFCRAADIRVAGVRPSAVARFAKTLPGINGVGTYRRKAIVHIDTRLQQMTWRY